MKKILLGIITAFVCIIFSNAAFAENFYIENYKVDLKVNEDKSVQVTENIQVQFTTPSHGIIRTIPYKNASISNVRVNNSYRTSYENSELNIKIGNPDRYVRGSQNYNIQYRYTIHDTNNEFYFNIIGTEWPVKIKHAGFTVTMPKDFDFEKAGLSIGNYGTVGFKDIASYHKEGNSIYGEITQPLPAYNGITLRIEVPGNYFTNVQKMKSMEKTTITGIIVLTLLSFFIWLKFGKDELIIPIVTFYPPKNLNSMEAEMLYKEKASTKGLIALLIELAGKGFVKIDDRPKDNNFSITKIKEYDGNNAIEKQFLDTLFKNSVSSINLSTLRTSSTFYKKCSELVNLCNKKRNTVFEASSLSNLNKAILIASIIGICFFTLLTLCNYIIPNIDSNMLLILMFPIIAIVILNIMPIDALVVIWALGFGGMPLIIFLSSLNINFDHLPSTCLGFCGIIISSICLKQIAKKNPRGQKMMSELLGLKKFLEVSEKHRLKNLAANNPSYFYDILPYAYILGVSDKWIEKFQTIMNSNPDWYCGSQFNMHNFNSFTSKMISTTVPTTQNGGIKRSSSGRGGFSGGGHGGGGGHSW